MNCNRSKCLAAIALYAVGIAASAQAGTASAAESSARLARAHHDVAAAEAALRANPAAAASFGPLLREARERLDAGMAAHQAVGIDASHDAMHADLGKGDELRPTSRDRLAHAGEAASSAPSTIGLQLHRRVHGARQIWA